MSDEDRVLLHHRSHTDNPAGVELLVVLVRLPLDRVVGQGVLELRLGAGHRIQQVFLKAVGVPVHRPVHAPREG